MKYLNPEEIKKGKVELKNAWGDEGASDMLTRGKALELCNRYAKKDWRILDVGCGSGLFAEMLMKKDFSNIFGFDVDNYVNGGGA